MSAALGLSVDDRRALWALTERCLRSPAFPAVLLVRDAVRRGAQTVHVRTRGDTLRVEDDGGALDDVLGRIAAIVAAPAVADLHRLEASVGTDLLVALVTAERATATGLQRSLSLRGGHVDRQPQVGRPTHRNVVVLHRPRRRRAAEKAELVAWLPSPRAVVLLDGHPIGAPAALPDDVVAPRMIRTADGRGQIGLALDSPVSRLTVLARGTWVTQDQLRPRGLAAIAIWDDDALPPNAADVVGRARSTFEQASSELAAAVAGSLPGLAAPVRRRVRQALMRGREFPAPFVDVPLFDGPAGPFSVSLRSLRGRSRVVLGAGVGDVFVDADSRAFLQQALAGAAVDALPTPTRRLRFLLGLP